MLDVRPALDVREQSLEMIARGEVGPLRISSQKTDPDSPENRVSVAARQVSVDICATWGLGFELSQRSCSRT
ncbi:MAG: hypothetical protein ACPGXX_20470, partial [Planctomycetaceae bacterium]